MRGGFEAVTRAFAYMLDFALLRLQRKLRLHDSATRCALSCVTSCNNTERLFFTGNKNSRSICTTRVRNAHYAYAKRTQAFALSKRSRKTRARCAPHVCETHKHSSRLAHTRTNNRAQCAPSRAKHTPHFQTHSRTSQTRARTWRTLYSRATIPRKGLFFLHITVEIEGELVFLHLI